VSDFFWFSNNAMRFETAGNGSAVWLSDAEDLGSSDLTDGAGVGKVSKFVLLTPRPAFLWNWTNDAMRSAFLWATEVFSLRPIFFKDPARSIATT
jgi:hypothetical protein